MFELKVKDKEENGFIYKIMTLDFGNRIEEIYIKLPISEKEYLTKNYDPYVFFNIFKMMSIGGDCKIKGNVNKSFLDNLEMFIECWKIWLPDKCKDIKIIAYDEIDDEPKKLNDDAVMCFSGGLDSVSTLYRHYKGLAGRNNKNIKKLLKIGGARTPTVIMANTDLDYNKIDEEISKRIINIANDIKYEVIDIDTNLYTVSSIFDWGDEFIALFISLMMLYQDIYNNLIIASDEFIAQDSIMVPHGSNPISNKFIKSNCFNLITDGEFLTRIDKMNVIKDWKYALNKLDACDSYRSREYKLCGRCKKCMITKLNYKIINADVNFNDIYDYPSFNLDDYSSLGEYFNIFYREILYYDKLHSNVPKYIINNLNNILSHKKNIKIR
ncbi:hypothetical protein BFL38_10865 [Brachyspira hampsonii]|uniref:7-cyano-7-deazaguanine synthase n=1 Tax=Brachyspira hampsonii TaxID=1287055 RepID=A0A1E5NIG5_9SPIR|nr:hypothetical protein [Brachyspira hampsonii]OEJ15950.1 hypothetical protein BFL38_10865 [Brachyspira hampsonii]